MTNALDPSKIASMRELLDRMSPEERTEAEYNLMAYLELNLRIFERISKDPVEWQRFLDLTHRNRNDTVKDDRPVTITN
jgi:hypothetical protein